MIVKILFAQRKCSYEGQYAPEVIAAITETAYEENPEFLDNMVKEVELEICESYDSKKFGYICASNVIDIEVDEKQIQALLNPSNPVLKGEIVGKG